MKTEIDVPDWVVDEALFCTPVHDGDELAMPIDLMNFGSPEMLDRARSAMRAALAAALGAWVVREGYIAGPELCGLDAARQLGTKFYGTVWSEPTGQAGTPLYTLRQEKTE